MKSKKKVPVPKDDWAVTMNTHPPLVSVETYEKAQRNLGRGAKNYLQYEHVRKSISVESLYVRSVVTHSVPVVRCIRGSEKNIGFFHAPTNVKILPTHVQGVRIRYADLVEIVKRDLNELLNMTDEGIDELVKAALESSGNADMLKAKKAQLQAAEARLLTIDKMVGKLYADNAEGRIDDDRLRRMVSDLEKESVTLKSTIAQLNHLTKPDAIKKDYERFFDMAKQYTHIEELTRDTLLTFVDRTRDWSQNSP